MKNLLPKLGMLLLTAPVCAMEPAAPVAKPPAAPAVAVPAAAPAESATLDPAVQTSPPVAQPGRPGARRAQDRLELDTTQITGNRELPRVLYVVPWKRSDLGDLTGRPANSLLDEVLAPVDRDVFRRQNRYYQALKPDSAGGGAASSTEVEK